MYYVRGNNLLVKSLTLKCKNVIPQWNLKIARLPPDKSKLLKV